MTHWVTRKHFPSILSARAKRYNDKVDPSVNQQRKELGPSICLNKLLHCSIGFLYALLPLLLAIRGQDRGHVTFQNICIPLQTQAQHCQRIIAHIYAAVCDTWNFSSSDGDFIPSVHVSVMLCSFIMWIFCQSVLTKYKLNEIFCSDQLAKNRG